MVGDNGFLSTHCDNKLTSIHTNEMQGNEVEIFPNPASQQLNIKSKRFDFNEIFIVDVSGRVMKTTTNETNNINVTKLPSGIYFINLVSDTNTIVKKFVKE